MRIASNYNPGLNMLHWLGTEWAAWFGPLRLLSSHLFLACVGSGLGFLTVFLLLPKLWRFLPTDKGRAHAVNAGQSVGKPVGAGIIFISIFCLLVLLFVPPNPRVWGMLAAIIPAMLLGYLDDKSGGFSEYVLGAADLAIALVAACIFCGFESVTVWLPFMKAAFAVPPLVFVPLATALIWGAINCTNCTDGVDGLSGSLSVIAFLYMGAILYAIMGHVDIARYLLVPHLPDGASWGELAFLMSGCLAGYIWHNAPPSAVLMGDAGSRPMGLLLGILVMASLNPFLILVVAGMVLANGGTGLVKVALLRFLKVGIFKNVRFPLHDHCRKNLQWTNAQVLVRFVMLQAVLTPLLLVALMKIR